MTDQATLKLNCTESKLQDSFDDKSKNLDNVIARLMAFDEHTIVSITDVDGKISYVNENFCHISKYSYDELVGAKHKIINSGHHPKSFFANMFETISKGQSWHGDIKSLAKNGSHFWTAATIVPLKDTEGKTTQYISIHSDITSYKITQEQDKCRADYLEQAVETISDAFVLYDETGTLIFCNQKHRDFYPHLAGLYQSGVNIEEILMAHAEKVCSTDPSKKYGQIFSEKLAEFYSPIPYQENQLLNGRWVATQKTRVNGEGLVSVRSDITRHKKMLQKLENQSRDAIELANELRNARDIQKDAIDNMSEGFILWDENDDLVLSNKAFKSFFQKVKHHLEKGISYKEFVTHAVDQEIFNCHGKPAKKVIQERVENLRKTSDPFEEQLLDGRWIRINKRLASKNRIVSIVTDITQQKEASKAIKVLANTDSLTSLPNRAVFGERLQNELQKAAESKTRVGVLLLDIDHFKSINDVLGHPFGDTLLCEVANRLRNCARNTDIVTRIGGDEFAIIATNISSEKSFVNLACRIGDAFEKPFKINNKDIFSSASIGIASYPTDGKNAIDILKNADIALYKVKAEGRRGYRVFDRKMDDEAKFRRTIEDDLRKAIKQNQLKLFYQPQIDAISGQIIGAEALLRWSANDGKMISPEVFIPVAEATGLIVEIGDWVIDTACKQAKEWKKLDLPSLTMAVNISPIQFKSQDLIEVIKKALKTYGLEPHQLEIEITEGVAMDNSSQEIFEKVKNLGVMMAIDDFGTGYSSLSQLINYPVNRLKIDKSFVNSDKHTKVCSAIINLGKSLGLKVIAEGVETMEQLEFLVGEGCFEMQGYLFAPALPANAFTEFVKRHNPKQIAQTSKKQFAVKMEQSTVAYL